MIILDGYDDYSRQDEIPGNLEEEHPDDSRKKCQCLDCVRNLSRKRS